MWESFRFLSGFLAVKLKNEGEAFCSFYSPMRMSYSLILTSFLESKNFRHDFWHDLWHLLEGSSHRSSQILTINSTSTILTNIKKKAARPL